MSARASKERTLADQVVSAAFSTVKSEHVLLNQDALKTIVESALELQALSYERAAEEDPSHSLLQRAAEVLEQEATILAESHMVREEWPAEEEETQAYHQELLSLVAQLRSISPGAAHPEAEGSSSPTVAGCTNHGCEVRWPPRPKGALGTNAICQCVRNFVREGKALELMRALQARNAEIRRLRAKVSLAEWVLASAYQAAGILVMSEKARVPSRKDQVDLLDLLSRWEIYSPEQAEAFLPWPKQWSKVPRE